MTSMADINNQFVSPEFNNIQTNYQKNKFLVQCFNTMQMAACESYINGLEIPDFLVKSNLDTMIPICYREYPFLLIPYEWLLKESEYLAEKSHELMETQYNLPKELFKVMLGESQLMYPKYTMALWQKGAINLEQAQIDMLDDLITKAQIKDGDHILDIGCGFGSALHYILSKFPNCQVTGLNLSKEHCQYIRNKIKDDQSYFSSDRFTLIEGDFNTINFEHKFDKIISLGVFEHIGNLTNGFKKVSSLLTDKGQFLLHIIAIKLPHSISSVFLEKYIFPRFRVWGYENVPLYNQDLKTVDKWFMNGSNYSKTLVTWLRNFDNNQEYLKTLKYDMEYSRFRRLWRLYLIWCIAYFDACNGEVLGNGQYLMTKA
ncbi:SAM-dependent methyltransferase [Cyanobacterium sp. IPPAS B-1200]|uniref:SAM-dependent methyltransferase n=1 Tax=Cyanobacterium sp. IPPAS B-1200 TaxID=1562720 RepID=UPI0008526361|nr:class I SAM-dependent methyltransferase [Cyanobacterium sp. IPPAS B-1200]OEJ78169.1 cyclopropane-fatty-acyl-phospholipid synthase [Cyanobacterium sp. IPPAS B-1200]